MKIISSIKNLSEHKKSIISNTLWLILEKGYRLILGFFVVSWVARYLGPVNFGMISYALALVALAIPVANLGLKNIVKKDLVLNVDNSFQILGSSFIIRFLASFLMFSILIISSFFYENDIQRIIICIISFALILNPFDQLEDYFASKLQSKIAVKCSTIALTITSIIKIILILLNFSVIALAISQVIETFLYSILLVIFYMKSKGSVLKWNWSWALTKQYLSDSWPLMFSGIAILIYMRIDQYMLNSILGSREVGIYSVAVKLSEIWYFVPAIVITSFFPNIVMNKVSDPIKHERQTKQIMMFMSALAISISIPLYFLAPYIVPLVFGSQYLESTPILQMHIWSCLFVFWGTAQGAWDVSENLTRFSLVRTSCGAITNVVLNFFLIPKWGGLGAAIATVISQATSAFIMNVFYKKTRQLFLIQIKSLFFWNAIKLQREYERKS